VEPPFSALIFRLLNSEGSHEPEFTFLIGGRALQPVGIGFGRLGEWFQWMVWTHPTSTRLLGSLRVNRQAIQFA